MDDDFWGPVFDIFYCMHTVASVFPTLLVFVVDVVVFVVVITVVPCTS